MKNGFIKLYRKVLENPVVCKDGDHLAVWIYLLLDATHSERYALFGGKKILLKPGETVTDRKTISRALNVSESKIQRILNLFKSEQQIEQQTSTRNRLITVINWQDYQSSEQQIERQVNINRTTSEQPLYKQECKNERKTSINDQFDAFWKAYPRKIGKQKALKAFERIKPDNALLSTMLNKIEAYKKTDQWQKNNGQFIPHPTTWLNAGSWEDEIEGGNSFVNQYKCAD